jgi:hypothetical protein
LVIGLEAIWLDGHELPAMFAPESQNALAGANLPPDPAQPRPWKWARLGRPDFPVAASYLSFFGLAFFVVRWWRLADRRRYRRFSLFAILVVALWGGILFTLWPGAEEPQGVMTLVLAAVIIQLVSPWQPVPPPAARRLRLRCA